jgi:hypothetical protein
MSTGDRLDASGAEPTSFTPLGPLTRVETTQKDMCRFGVSPTKLATRVNRPSSASGGKGEVVSASAFNPIDRPSLDVLHWRSLGVVEGN